MPRFYIFVVQHQGLLALPGPRVRVFPDMDSRRWTVLYILIGADDRHVETFLRPHGKGIPQHHNLVLLPLILDYLHQCNFYL